LPVGVLIVTAQATHEWYQGLILTWVLLHAFAVWFAAQKSHSKGAQSDILQAKYNLACAQHLPPTFIGDHVKALQ
jgi:hypothetical protein